MNKILKLLDQIWNQRHSRFIYILVFILALIYTNKYIYGEPTRWRATWWSDPATSIAIGFDYDLETSVELEYHEMGERDGKTHRVKVNKPEKGESYWLQLTGLTPNTKYNFHTIVSKDGKELHSKKLWFRTLPDKPSHLKIIAGGDSRNHREIRRAANKTVAEIEADFVLFAGDFTSRDSKKQWKRWFDDWQLSISPSGRLTPLLPARGNHDSEKKLGRAWGRAHQEFYYVTKIAGNLLWIYTLNSERPAGGDQVVWFESQLDQGAQAKLRWAQYHKPMRPHVRLKSEGNDEYRHWAPLFARYALDLAIECDSHVMKVTYPLWPNLQGVDGFERVQRGTTFIGEGGWGAPLRSVDDVKPWTLSSARINHLFYIEVEPSGTYRLTPLRIHAGTHTKPQGETAKIEEWRDDPKTPIKLKSLTYAVPIELEGEQKQNVSDLQSGYHPLELRPLKLPPAH